MISEIQANSAALVVFVVKVYNKEKQGALSRLDIVRHQIVMVEWWTEYLNRRKGRETT